MKKLLHLKVFDTHNFLILAKKEKIVQKEHHQDNCIAEYQ